MAYSYLGTNFQVQVQIGINPVSGQITASFRSIDPNTNLPPRVNICFLPPEDGIGHGRVGNMSTNVAAPMNVTAHSVANGIWTNLFIVAESDGAAAANTTEVLYIGVLPVTSTNRFFRLKGQ